MQEKFNRFFKIKKTILVLLSLFSLSAYTIYNYPVSIMIKTGEFFYPINGFEKEFINSLETYSLKPCQGSNCHCSLFIHGLGDNYLTWINLIREILVDSPQTNNLYLINLPGSGQSQTLTSQEDYNGDKVADLVYKSFSDRCKKAIVLGNSFGGYISLKLAARHQSFVKALLLTSPAGLNKDYSNVTNVYLNPSANGIIKLQSMAYHNPPHLPKFLYSDLAKRLSKMPVDAYIKAQTPELAIDKELPKILVPTQIVWGVYDKVIPIEHGYEMTAKLPNAELRVIDNCAHIAQKQCSSDVYASLKHLQSRIKKKL
jgi:pimeloyl-ACP methyl ester carboxylesterase